MINNNKKPEDEKYLLPPFAAYRGDKPFIFVSYSHKDKSIVYPELMRLHNAGYRIWYDEGIVPGEDWTENIETALLKCSVFLVWISNNAVKSKFVKREMHLAVDREETCLTVYLEETPLPGGWKLQLSPIQAIYKYSIGDDDYFWNKLQQALPDITCEINELSSDKSTSIESTSVNTKPPIIKETPSKLYLTSEPSGAAIFIEGVDSGYLTPYFYTETLKQPRKLLIEFKLDGYDISSNTANMQCGKTDQIHVQLTKPDHSKLRAISSKTKNIPIINGRRTLIIGLGTSGAKVCNQILERLLWTYNSPNNIPWLRTMVLDTADIDEEKLVKKYANFIHLNINTQEYTDLITNPENYQQTMDFSSWNIPELTATTDQITDGANITRILGRLALLFSKNILKVQGEISRELMQLGSLQNKEASEVFSSAIEELTNVDLSIEVHVYVVGSLCGGTASGSFIDLGYLLQSLPGLYIESTGIFLLPSTVEQNPLFIANTYAALVELNHFSDDRTQYKTQFACGAPGIPFETPTPGIRPYRNQYIVQPRGASPIEYAKLLSSCADFIYSDVLSSTAMVRDAIRTNVKQFFMQRDSWGAPQKFFTFGLSTIEYPLAKVVKACTIRLAQRGFEELVGGNNMTDNEVNSLIESCPLLNVENIILELQTYQSISLSKTIHEVVFAAFTGGLHSDDSLHLLMEQLETAFTGGSLKHHKKLPEKIIPQVIETNSLLIIQTFRKNLIDTIRTMLCGPAPLGLQSLLSGLDALALVLQSIKDEEDIIDDSANSLKLTDLLKKIKKSRTDFWLILGLQKNIVINKLVRQFLDLTITIHHQRLKSLCIPYCEAIANEGLQIIASIRRRIRDAEHPDSGLVVEVNKIIAGLNNLYINTDVPSGTNIDGWSRVVNGTELFIPEQTINEDYWNCLRKTAIEQGLDNIDNNQEIEKKMGQIAIREYLKNVADNILADSIQITKFDFDQYNETQDSDINQLLEIATPVQTIFKNLRTRNLVNRLLDRDDLQTILQDASNASKRFLDWSDGHPRYYSHQNKSYGCTFYNDNDPQAAAFNQCLSVEGILNDTNARGFADRNQLFILHENGAFSLGTVGMLKDEMPSFWRNSYKNPPGYIPSLHSRGDIEDWISWDRKDEETRVSINNLFLTAAALSIIEFNGGTDYRYASKKTRPTDPGYIQFNNDLGLAAFSIKNKKLEKILSLSINNWREKEGDTELVRVIVDFIEKYNDGRFIEAGQELSAIDIEAYLLEYIFQDSKLKEIYTTTFYKDSVFASLQRDDYDGKTAYYCPNPKCSHLLGYNITSLFMYEAKNGRRQRVRKCSFCRNEL